LVSSAVPGPAMMSNYLSKTAREYRAYAATARALANAATDPHAKRTYLDFSRYWLDRALDYETAELAAGKP